MPFASIDQEYFLMINHPDIWKKWVSEHGHAKGWNKRKRRKSKSPITRRNKRKRK